MAAVSWSSRLALALVVACLGAGAGWVSVAHAGAHHKTIQQMVAIAALPGDMQGQVHLGPGETRVGNPEGSGLGRHFSAEALLSGSAPSSANTASSPTSSLRRMRSGSASLSLSSGSTNDSARRHWNSASR